MENKMEERKKEIIREYLFETLAIALNSYPNLTVEEQGFLYRIIDNKIQEFEVKL